MLEFRTAGARCDLARAAKAQHREWMFDRKYDERILEPRQIYV